MLSPGSRSRMWDIDADGYARGDGVAALVLKTLSQALADGDDIECIIRETGVNQDGRTKGITMPSSLSQQMLIRDTYAKAGLDLTRATDRPQFFEAHGTGTPAGDPQEASAICNAFFGNATTASTDEQKVNNAVLHVGSIKTVIGHTEGTAGIAALLKASLAMRHNTIPPNLLFRQLNPEVEPYYGNLQIPTSAIPWPSVPSSQPKRASVNSFGFGGTNAHAILESFSPSTPPRDKDTPFLPFVFSAASEASLRGNVQSMLGYLAAKGDGGISARDLAYTLNFRRSVFPYRKAFSSTSIAGLVDKMQLYLEQDEDPPASAVPSAPVQLLGIFTGQGAQWASMGRELIRQSQFVRDIVQRLEAVLSELPEGDRPSWSLMQEMLADPAESRVQQAALSQPLCTVVQIVLVNMIHAAGIHFSAVVGHSSGEIGAAYAAGFLSASDALRIAYYRGLHSGKARSPSGAQGAMLAVGTSFEDAKDLCQFEDMLGRISVAACNSPASVTISGDVDAIDEAMTTFQDEKKFVRKLKVDTAYHSHHMLPCSRPYIDSLEACNIRILPSAGSTCTWFSSVTGKPVAADDNSLQATYWSDNMTLPVLFAQAIEAAFQAQPSLAVAFELGPHPALKGPALQTIQDAIHSSIPYHGLLERGKNDIEAVADALAFAATQIPPTMLNLRAFDDAMSGNAPAALIKGLPSYSWDHTRVYWKESRVARAHRIRETPVHELLGTLLVESGQHQFRWRNVISPKEIAWLDGHGLQGQTVFPAAGYVSMAVEAAKAVARTRPVRLIQMEDLVISKAMVFSDEEATAEILFTLNIDTKASTESFVQASFEAEGTTNQESDDLVTFFSGTVSIHLGDPDSHVLLPRAAPLVDTVDVDHEHFYQALLPIGYHYSGDFKALRNMKRTTDSGTAAIKQPEISKLTVHPATLDCAIQALLLAYSWPEDNRLWGLHVPVKITRFQLNPSLMEMNGRPEILLPVDSLLGSAHSSIISGDISIYAPDGSAAIMQLEGVEVIPFTASSPEQDAKLFYNMRWNVAGPQGHLISHGLRATPEDHELSTSIDRVCYLYLKFIYAEIADEEWNNAEWHFRQMKLFAEDVMARVENGTQPGCDKNWRYDERHQIEQEIQRWPGNIDLKLIKAVGDNLASAIRGETMILEHMVGYASETYTCILTKPTAPR